VRRTVETTGADLVILDNLSDVFGGDEMVRLQAKRFVNLLNRICEELRCTVILISHPSLSGMADGTGRSGSTGWPSAVRAFWYLRRPQKAEEAGDKTARELANPKANRGLDCDVIERFREGAIYKLPGSRSFLDLVAHRARVRDLFIKLYDACKPVVAVAVGRLKMNGKTNQVCAARSELLKVAVVLQTLYTGSGVVQQAVQVFACMIWLLGTWLLAALQVPSTRALSC
jgi:hypothetical protein